MSPESGDRQAVLVHGIWMPGEEMAFVRRHLENDHGISSDIFSYPSVKGTLSENALLLADFIDHFEGTVDIVGHSLGGVLALRTLAEYPDLTHGRVVCMGSPLAGSRAAAVLDRTDWGRFLMGKTLKKGVVEHSAEEWAADVLENRQVGSIAGTQGIGLGKIVTKFDEANDGTVSLSETILPGLTDHIALHVTHSGMVLSAQTIDQAAAFLKTGAFQR